MPCALMSTWIDEGFDHSFDLTLGIFSFEQFWNRTHFYSFASSRMKNSSIFAPSELDSMDGLSSSRIAVKNTFLDTEYKLPSKPVLQKSFSMPPEKVSWDVFCNELKKMHVQIPPDIPAALFEDQPLHTQKEETVQHPSSEASSPIHTSLETHSHIPLSPLLPAVSSSPFSPEEFTRISLTDYVRENNFLRVPGARYSSHFSDIQRSASVSDYSESSVPLCLEGAGSNFTIRNTRIGKSVVEYSPLPISFINRPQRKIQPKMENQNISIEIPLFPTSPFPDISSQSYKDSYFDCEKDSDSEDKSVSPTNALPLEELTDELIQSIPKDESGNLLSVGSIEHESGNCKGCVFFHHSTKKCKNGIRCLFCHFPHLPKKRIRINKMRSKQKQRQQVQPTAEQTSPSIQSFSPLPTFNCGNRMDSIPPKDHPFQYHYCSPTISPCREEPSYFIKSPSNTFLTYPPKSLSPNQYPHIREKMMLLNPFEVSETEPEPRMRSDFACLKGSALLRTPDTHPRIPMHYVQMHH
ncbi:hypothetical protein IE077_003329 [Cardiosporidium cionae]|uniref:C3H1-type domain-containing protein n=1 Tax=Cardiosporidium cionae TaxID=476202 RepID=A0ABQ7J8H0_9APIC|nr:hypothetical protein IE077_003329 [Cardiosporidium cionae]|eukprot:KAF8820288.1 hypothetical protein IE077_003329 [Cardiosporidium cionae]